MADNPKLMTMLNLYTLMDEEARKDSIDDIIYEWAGVSDIDENAKRGGVSARDMAVYEKLSGKSFLWKGRSPNANSYLTPVINEKFAKFKDYVYANIELQTTYSDKDFINYTMRYSYTSKTLEYDFKNINDHILSLYENKKYKKIVEFSTLLQNATTYKPHYQAALKQNYKTLSNQDIYLLGLCLNTFILGTSNNDTLVGNTEDNIIEGFGGDDI